MAGQYAGMFGRVVTRLLGPPLRWQTRQPLDPPLRAGTRTLTSAEGVVSSDLPDVDIPETQLPCLLAERGRKWPDRVALQVRAA